MPLDPVDGLARSYDALHRVVSGLSPDDLARPTPCEGWDVRTVLNHALSGFEVFTKANRDGEPMTMPDASVDRIGDDPAASLTRIAEESVAAWRIGDAASKPVGPIPGVAMIDLNLADAVVHAWDVARAIGAEPSPPADVVDYLLAKLEAGWAEMGAQMGAFGAPKEVAPDAPPFHRLLALTGRQP